jgi:hypothetical protein
LRKVSPVIAVEFLSMIENDLICFVTAGPIKLPGLDIKMRFEFVARQRELFLYLQYVVILPDIQMMTELVVTLINIAFAVRVI